MRSKSYKLASKPTYGRYTLVFFAVLFLYIVLIIIGLKSLSQNTPSEVGQFMRGEGLNGQPFSHSLDLRVAAKNSYPSTPLSVVKVLTNANGVKQEIISFGVPADGLTEYGLAVIPSSPKPAGGYPALILCHGYFNPVKYTTQKSYVSDMVFYAQHGFLVVNPDYRGEGYSLHEGTADSAYYSMAYNTDVMSLITSLKQTNYIDKSNINLWGHSMGAYIALRAAVLSSSIKNLILLSGPVDSLSKMYLTFIPPSDENNLNALKTRQDVFSKYGIPAENTAFWKYASPINLVGHIKAHVQINVGALDQTVPPQFSADLNQALNTNHIPHDYYVYSDGDHGLGAQRSLIWQRSLQALQASAKSPA